jgi:hypothetical protein
MYSPDPGQLSLTGPDPVNSVAPKADGSATGRAAAAALPPVPFYGVVVDSVKVNVLP